MSNITAIIIKTMTSREIAELTGKEHAHVMRDIRAMLSELELAEGGYLQNWIHPQNGQTYQEFALNRELTETLLTGYSASARLKVIRRWHELEEQAAKPAFALPQTMSEALRLAADLADGKAKAEAQLEQKQVQLAIAAPKADALDRFSTFAEGSMCLTNAAKALQIQPKKFFAWMQENQWIYRRAGGSGFVGYQSRIQVGYLEHKVTTVERTDGTTKQAEQVLVTAKGLAKLALLLSAMPTANESIMAQAA